MIAPFARLMLFVASDILLVAAAEASLPVAYLSTCPQAIRLVGSAPSGPDVTDGMFQVLVRDAAANPIPGSRVTVSFCGAVDLRICQDQQNPAYTVDCTRGLVSALTNEQGIVQFTILGGSFTLEHGASRRGSVRIYADDPMTSESERVLLSDGTTSTGLICAALDLSGEGGANAADLSEFSKDQLGAQQPPTGSWQRSDFNGDGLVNNLDLSYLLTVLSSSRMPLSCADYCAGCVLSSTGTACMTAPPGLIAWWPFDEEVAGFARDIAQGNSGGDSVYPTPTPGYVLGGYRFDGVSQGIHVPAHPSLGRRCDVGLTIDAWINPEATQLDLPLVSNVSRYEFRLDQAAGVLTFKMYGQTGEATYSSDPANPIPASVWSHVAVVVSPGVVGGANGTCSFYLDGVQIGHWFIQDAFGNASGAVLLGAPATGAVFYKGLIDEVDIFGRPLGPAEIAAIYEAGAFGKCKCDRLSPGNLVRNGSFECGSTLACVDPLGGLGGLHGWEIENPRPDWVGAPLPDCNDSDNDVVATTDLSNGNRFIFLRDEAGHRNEGISSDLSEPLQIGQRYTLSFWGSTLQSGQRGNVHVLFDGDTHRWSDGKKFKRITALTGQWGYYSKTFVAEKASRRVTLQAERDNLALDGVVITPTICDCNLVPNGSFETSDGSYSAPPWYVVKGRYCVSRAGTEFCRSHAVSAADGLEWANLFGGDPDRGGRDAMGVALAEALVPGKWYRLAMWFATGDGENADQFRDRAGLSVYLSSTQIGVDQDAHIVADQRLIDLKFKGFHDEWKYFEVIFEARDASSHLALEAKTRWGADQVSLAVDGVCLVPWPSPDPGGASAILDPYRHQDLIGDLDADVDVDTGDLALLQAAFGRADGESAFNFEADLDADGVVTLADYQGWFDDYQEVNRIAVAVRPHVLHPMTIVRCVPDSLVLAVGETAVVDIVADLDVPVFGWGLDVALNPAGVVSLASTPDLGPAWIALPARDGDGLAGWAFPVEQQAGDGVLLARVSIHADAPGVVTLAPGVSDGDLGEGIAIAPINASLLTFGSVNIVVNGVTGVGPGDENIAWLAPSSTLGVRPNPSRAETEVAFRMASAGAVRLSVFDLSGRRIKVLLEGAHKPGVHVVTWNGRDVSGNLMRSGVYLIRVETPDRSETVKMIVAR